jgi:hypothetical protein
MTLVTARSCIFCGDRSLTREHVLSDWIRRLAAIDGAAPANHTFQRPGVAPRVVEFDAPPLAQTARVACGACNNGWMAQLEAEASGVLGPMLQGRPCRLETTHLALLARWAFKTAFVIDAASIGSGPHAPRSHRESMRELGEPPHMSAVWMTTWPGTTTAWTQHWGIAASAGGAGTIDAVNTYGATIAVGPLVFRTYCTTEPALHPDYFHDVLDGITRIWPAPSALQWQPKFHLTAQQLEDFAFGLPRAIEEAHAGEHAAFWRGETESGRISGPV